MGNEIVSCLHHLLTTSIHLANEPKIILRSNGCIGQNKNKMEVAASLSAIHDRPVGTTNLIKYFETGHSCMEADAIPAVIQ